MVQEIDRRGYGKCKISRIEEYLHWSPVLPFGIVWQGGCALDSKITGANRDGCLPRTFTRVLVSWEGWYAWLWLLRKDGITGFILQYPKKKAAFMSQDTLV